MTAMRTSLDRLALTSSGSVDEITALKRRAWTEQGIAVVDIGKVRNGDFAFAAWLRQETERQLGIRQGGKTA